MPLVPSYIKKLNSYKPGKPIGEVQRELGLNNIIKLASNENPLGASPKALDAIQEAMVECHRYPDASGYELRKKLSERFNVGIDNVVLGAGSEGIMSTIMRTFLLSDDELISAENSFIGFRVLANASGKRIHWVPMDQHHYDLEAMANKITDYTKIIYIANPDNPMGTYITKKEFDEFYSHVPERVLIILDEAYFEFAHGLEDYPDSMTYRYDNVITLRSFSKAYGLGGIRIGYGFAEIIGKRIFVNIDDKDFLSRTLELNEKGMKYIKGELELLEVRFIPSIANFITTIWESETKATNLTNDLLEKGVIVRQLTAFGWPNYIRISIGLEEENHRFIESLKEIL